MAKLTSKVFSRAEYSRVISKLFIELNSVPDLRQLKVLLFNWTNIATGSNVLVFDYHTIPNFYLIPRTRSSQRVRKSTENPNLCRNSTDSINSAQRLFPTPSLNRVVKVCLCLQFGPCAHFWSVESVCETLFDLDVPNQSRVHPRNG